MKITRTEPLKKGIFRVWINDEPAFRISGTDLEELGFKEGDALEERQLAYIHTQYLIPAARRRCLDILLPGDKTRMAVWDKLKREDYPEDVIEDAVRYAQQYHYIDDKRFAGIFIRQYREKASPAEIIARLRSKGVDEETIREAMEEAEPFDAEEQIRRLAEKKGYDPETAEKKETERFYRFLIRKGFSYNDIKKTLT